MKHILGFKQRRSSWTEELAPRSPEMSHTHTHTHLANWKMSKTNFSILIPFGLSGLMSRPDASTCGIFFWATWCCSCGSYFLTRTQTGPGSCVQAGAGHPLNSDSLHNVSEKREGEEVVGHVSRVEHEPAVDAALLSGCQGDFAVLHHLIAPVHLTDNTYRLCGIGLLHHLENRRPMRNRCYENK